MKFLHLLFAVLLDVFGHTLLDGLLQVIDAVAAGIADADLGGLHLLAALLHQLFAAFLGEGRNGDADNLAVVLGHDAQRGVDDGFLDDAHHTLVPGTDGNGAGIGGRDGGHIVERDDRAVAVHADAVKQTYVGFARTDVSQFVFNVHDGHFHHFLSFVQIGFQILHGCNN